MYKSLGIFGAGEIAVSILAQVDAMPDGLIGIFAQIPFVIAFIWYVMQNDKAKRDETEKTRLWIEHMLETQREGIKEAYEDSNKLLLTLIGQMEKKD